MISLPVFLLYPLQAYHLTVYVSNVCTHLFVIDTCLYVCVKYDTKCLAVLIAVEFGNL